MKNVFVPSGDRGVGAELLDQLGIFGMTVHEFSEAGDVLRLAKSLGGGILLADAARIEREPAFVAELTRLRNELDGRLRILFYSDRDDFATRLRTVRAGGEAFFQLPVDTLRLLDRIDALFSGQQGEPYQVLIVDDDADEVAKINPVLPRVLDAFQVYLRELRASDLDGSAGLFRVKEDLQKRINIAIYPGRVDAVLFREIIIQ